MFLPSYLILSCWFYPFSITGAFLCYCYRNKKWPLQLQDVHLHLRGDQDALLHLTDIDPDALPHFHVKDTTEVDLDHLIVARDQPEDVILQEVQASGDIAVVVIVATVILTDIVNALLQSLPLLLALLPKTREERKESI